MRDPETRIERAVAELRRSVRLDRAFDTRVMAAVRALPRHRFGSWARLLRPRTITVSPLISAVAAVTLFVAALSAGHAIGSGRIHRVADGRGESPGSASTRSDSGGDVQFVLVAPTARKVAVVGDFNDWNASHEAYQ